MSAAGLIVGVGMSSPLGLDARQSALVLRARKLAPAPTSFRDRRGGSVGDVRARRLDDGLVGRARLLALAAPALAEATRDLPAGGPLPLFLALPARRAEAEEPLGPTFLAELGQRAGVPLALDQCEPFALGHAGFAAALARALERVAARAVPFAVVGGVDSHHDPAVLAALDAERRLHAEGAWDGFIPSEAAAFVVVAPADAGARGAVLPFARVTAVVTGMEADPLPEGAAPGEAATEVVRAALAGLATPLAWVLPDVNGERHRIKEWTFVRMRNSPPFEEGQTIETRLYDELGDVGAASGAVHAVFASMAFRTGFAPAREVLVALASEGPLRGAFALEAT
jgi:3-oxoacyl-[acyl-carrier-protein] synthase-1